MATSNFLVQEASKVFAFGENDIDYEDTIENVKYDVLDLKLQDTKDYNFEIYEEDKYIDISRSYPSRCFASIVINFDYAGVEFSYIIELIETSGYYSGVNLDYITRFVDVYGYDYDNLDDIIDDTIVERPELKGIISIHKDNLNKKFETAIDYVKEKIEKVYSENTTPLCVVATFSNGETIYSACS